MVPGGVKNTKPLMCLARNVRKDEEKLLGTGFWNTWISMKSDLNPKRSAFSLRFKKDEIITCPIAHGEGRYTTLNAALIKTLEANEQILFKYCDEKGETVKKYPVNPNGASDNIAAIINPEGNIMAAMPHFEHFYEIGRSVFDSMFEYVTRGNSLNNLDIPKLDVLPEYKVPKLSKYKTGKKSFEMFIRLIITDNEEDSVNSVLENIGFGKTNLERFIHFEIEHDYSNEELFGKLPDMIRSGELLNTNKEICEVKINNKTYKFSNDKGFTEEKNRKLDNAFLVREIDDYIGMGKCQNLKYQLGFSLINVIRRGILWDFGSLKNEKVEEIINTRMLHNPHAQVILEY
jgi:phosphoribosylformylglycinamidine synthase